MSKKQKIIAAALWAAIILLCVVNRDHFSLDKILYGTPDNPLLAALFLLALFALKSLSVFFYSGILYIASGILFPLPWAVAVNLAGTVIMVSLPYWMGRRGGRDTVRRVVEKYPKAQALEQLQSRNQLFFSFITRIINLLPCDLLSLYMGAAGIGYGRYLAGCLLGMLPTMITFPIMGTSVTEPASPRFLIALGIEAAITAAACGGYALYVKRRRGEAEA